MKKRGWGSGRLHNLIMSAGILTPFDDLVRREEEAEEEEEMLSLSLSFCLSLSSIHDTISILSLLSV